MVCCVKNTKLLIFNSDEEEASDEEAEDEEAEDEEAEVEEEDDEEEDDESAADTTLDTSKEDSKVFIFKHPEWLCGMLFIQPAQSDVSLSVLSRRQIYCLLGLYLLNSTNSRPQQRSVQKAI